MNTSVAAFTPGSVEPQSIVGTRPVSRDTCQFHGYPLRVPDSYRLTAWAYQGSQQEDGRGPGKINSMDSDQQLYRALGPPPNLAKTSLYLKRFAVAHHVVSRTR
jgi:hypothetical protein